MSRSAWPEKSHFACTSVPWRWVGSKVSSETVDCASMSTAEECPQSRRRREALRAASAHRFSGGYGGGATPDPIPNSVVKPSSADGTAGVTLWESRTLPDLWAGSERSRPMPFKGLGFSTAASARSSRPARQLASSAVGQLGSWPARQLARQASCPPWRQRWPGPHHALLAPADDLAGFRRLVYASGRFPPGLERTFGLLATLVSPC